MTLLKAANIFLFQWLFIRLTKCQEQKVENYRALSYDLMPDGNISARGMGDIKTYQWFSLQLWILPCTGWWSDFIYLNKSPKFIKLTKMKSINK